MVAKENWIIPRPMAGKTQEQGWREEWKDMPEFQMEDKSSYRKIVVHFRNEEDVQKFVALMEQVVGPKQKSLWYPYLEPRRYKGKEYVDETPNEP